MVHWRMALVHICDIEGILFEVTYSGPPPVEIQSVYVLDENYRATGPDLTYLLANTLLMTGVDEAEKFLSNLVEELPKWTPFS